jgi:membrane protein insertase Oxa1/YidC/SpoIIIJ
MGFLNLLTNVAEGITLWGQTYDVYLNWIGVIIRWLIETVGNVGVGIIVFSILLKVIVMPFDVFQRITMRKQNAQMKDNQEKMAKLQKQYANNKELYNQKVMEMYKENGFSLFSSCLPMILSIVIFIVAINAFNAYAEFSSVNNYNEMVKAYNAKLESYCPDLDNYDAVTNGNIVTIKGKDANDYIFYTIDAPTQGELDKNYIQSAKKSYYVDYEKLYVEGGEFKAQIDELLAQKNEDGSAKYTLPKACQLFMISLAQDAVVEKYESTVSGNTKFLWIKNIWMTDASYVHPVAEYSDFESKAKQEDFNVNGKKVGYTEVQTDVYRESAYNIVTAKLDKQKGQANGYFIMILLSVGTILLQQWISMRAQKEQSQFSTVDGQGAQQQKMMMIMMTGMFAVFSFMYSAAFSIYMITSNVLSLISMLVINKLVDMTLEKKEQKALQDKYNQRFPGRVYKGDKTNENKKK